MLSFILLLSLEVAFLLDFSHLLSNADNDAVVTPPVNGGAVCFPDLSRHDTDEPCGSH